MLKTISRVCLLSALFTPLIYSQSLYMPFTGGKAIFFRILIELSLFFLLAHLLVSRNSREQWQGIYVRLKNPFVIALGVFVSLFTLTALLGVNPTQSWWSNFGRGEGAFQLLHYFFFFLLLVVLFPYRREFERVLKLHILVSVLVCLYGIYQLLAADMGQLHGRVVSTLGNPSFLAGYLLLTLPFLIYFLRSAKNRNAVLFWGGLIFLEVFMLFWTQTRAALLALVIGGAVVLVSAIFRARQVKVRRLLAAIALAGALFCGLFIATHNASFWRGIPLLSRVADFNVLAGEFAPRLWAWESAVSGFKERPLLGWGAENFAYPFDHYYDPRQFTILATEENQDITREYRFFTFDRTHNIFLEQLISGGVLLFVAWLSIFFFYYRKLLREKKDFWFSVMLAVPIAYLTQAFFFFDAFPIYVALFIFLAFSTMNSDDERHTEKMYRSSYQLNGTSTTVGVIILGVAALMIYQTGLLPLRKNILLAQAVATPRASVAFENYVRALEFSSPIGQQEAVNALAKFELRLFETAAQRGDVAAIPIEQVRILVDTHNLWFERAGDIFLGVEGAYWNGAVNIEAGLTFNQEDYLARGKALYEDVLVRSPHRLEFIKALMRVARVEGDEESYQKYRSIADSLRPDINWE